MQNNVSPISPAVKTRIVPSSVEAEESLLGGLLVDPEAIARSAGTVTPDDFYSSVNRTIYASMLSLYEKDKPVDLVTIASELADLGKLKDLGGVAYLNRLIDNMPSSANLEAYADIIKEKAVMRSMIAAAHDIQALGYQSQLTCAEYLDQAELRIFSISGSGIGTTAKGYLPLKDFIREQIQTVEELYTKKRSVTGVPTGFIDLDTMTSGLQPGNLVVIAARPSMGKTTLALNIAQHVATMHENVPVGIVSLEMTKGELLLRLLSSESEIDHSKLRTGTFSPEEWQKLAAASAKMAAAPIAIDDTGGQTVIDIRARARRLKRDSDIGLLVVDYLQLVHARKERDRREQEIAEVSRFLKALAKELNIPVVALSQLNRDVEKRDNKRPHLADLRESGAIEQDADVILFIYRDEVYNPSPDNPDKGIAEIIIGKQRNGPTGTVKLCWHESLVRFANLYHRITA